jgi:methionyl-tRNA formyltransferase
MGMSSPLRIAFFGTPAFAVPTLAALLDSRHHVVGVVSQPDKPRGRGQKTSAAPVKELAMSAGVPVLQPERLKDPAFLEAFRAWSADLGVVAAYGKILPDVLIQTPAAGLVNVHASLLPKYRGAAPIQRAVMAGDRQTGVTIMRIVRELDAGAMFARTVRPILPDATSEDVERDLAEAGAALLVEVVDAIAAGTAREEPQDDSLVTYAPKIAREEGIIVWSRPAVVIHDQIRALIPWPRASTHVDNGSRLIIARSAVEEADSSPWSPGTVVTARGDSIRIATGEGFLRILEAQPEGRRAMTARELLAGRLLAADARLT